MPSHCLTPSALPPPRLSGFRLLHKLATDAYQEHKPFVFYLVWIVTGIIFGIVHTRIAPNTLLARQGLVARDPRSPTGLTVARPGWRRSRTPVAQHSSPPAVPTDALPACPRPPVSIQSR